jgi:hypothetical protein
LRLNSAMLVILALQVGCAGIKLPGLQLGSNGNSGGGSSAGAGSGGDAEESTLKLYQELTYENVPASSADAIFNKSGIKTGFNPRNKMSNPDPEWIPKWEGLKLTDETKTAIAQAAINKSWTAACHKDFEAYRAGWQKIADANRAELDGLRKGGNYYSRADGLAALLEKVKKEAETAKVLHNEGRPQASVGFMNEIVVAMVNLHHETKRDFVANKYFTKHKIRVAAYAESGRPFADNADERDIFCSAARKAGTPSLVALPTVEEYGNGFAAIKWPVAKERAAEVAKKRDALVASNKTALSFQSTLPGDLINGSSPGKEDPKLYHVWAPEGESGTDHDTPFTVKAAKSAGAATVLEVESERTRLQPYDCRSTSKIDRIENGTVYYVKDCKYQTVVSVRAVTVELGELPPGLEIKTGDHVSFYGDLIERTESPVKGTKDKASSRDTFKFAGRHLGSVRRDKTVLRED